jgi:hypothetical protein
MLTRVNADVVTFDWWPSWCLCLTAFNRVAPGAFTLCAYPNLHPRAPWTLSYLQNTFWNTETLWTQDPNWQGAAWGNLRTEAKALPQQYCTISPVYVQLKRINHHVIEKATPTRVSKGYGDDLRVTKKATPTCHKKRLTQHITEKATWTHHWKGYTDMSLKVYSDMSLNVYSDVSLKRLRWWVMGY